MRGSEHGIYCTVDEAAYVLGLRPFEIRERMKAGTLNIGTAEKRSKNTVYRIRRDLVVKEAGLTEFPAEVITGPKNRKAEYAGLMMKKDGIDAKAIAEILLEAKIITPRQRDTMAGVM